MREAHRRAPLQMERVRSEPFWRGLRPGYWRNMVPGGDEVERVRRAMAGDAEAFAELVARYRDAVYGVCYHRVGHAEEAKDLAQEAFLRAYLDLGQLRDPEAFPAWLRRVTERVCATWQRRRRLQTTSLESAPDPLVQQDLDLPLAVHQALAQLSDDARLAVTLYYIDGYSTREVAEFLGVPAGTVKSRLHHARRRLKEELMNEYRDTLKLSVPGPEFEGAVVRAARSLEEVRTLPLAQRHGGPESEEELDRYLVLEKDGSVLGECYYHRDKVPIRGIMVEAVRNSYASGESGTDYYWQEKGFAILDRLTTSALANAAESGFALAAWHGELMCATRHGYVPCFYRYRITAPAQNLLTSLHAEDVAQPPSAVGARLGSVRGCRDSDGEAVARMRAMDRPRPAMWAWQGPEAFPDYVLERDGAIVGCYSLAPKHAKVRDTASLLNEMEGADMAAYRALAEHWAETALRDGIETLTTYLCPEHPMASLMLSCGGVCEMQGASWNVAKDEEMLCILDLAAALQAVAPGLGRAAKGRVTIEMDGEMATICAGDPPRVEKGLPAKAAPSRIGRVPMTQLLVGYRSVFEIEGRADVQVRDEHRETLAALFPKTWPYSWPDPYIWDENNLRESRPWAFEEPWVSRLAAQPRPWA